MARVEFPRCKLPESSCYCKGLRPEPASIDILILQHPSETRHPLNSARIAELGISNCNILVGEDFNDSETLHNLIRGRKACLLFPSPQAITTKEFVQQHERPKLCIALDGTWCKAKKSTFSILF